MRVKGLFETGKMKAYYGKVYAKHAIFEEGTKHTVATRPVKVSESSYIRHRKVLESIQDHKCFYCERTLAGRVSTLDHVVPRHLGGARGLTNLVVACYTCNHKKGCRPPTVEELDRAMALPFEEKMSAKRVEYFTQKRKERSED